MPYNYCVYTPQTKNPMNPHISDKDKCKYMQILAELNRLHAKIFTLDELSKHFGVSVRKLSDFKNGKVIDFWLLT